MANPYRCRICGKINFPWQEGEVATDIDNRKFWAHKKCAEKLDISIDIS